MALADRPLDEQLAIRYCVPRGIPLSVFRGRVVYPGDPQWLAGDTRAALDWQADQDGRCSGCGQPLNECMADEDHAPEYDAVMLRCWACEARQQQINVIQADKGAGSGLYVYATKVN